VRDRISRTPAASLLAWLLAALLAVGSGCGTSPGGMAAPDAGHEASEGETGTPLTAAEEAALAALSPALLPTPPRDPTNRYADDPAAAALGQKLFFDRGFSGPLLDSDNDGSEQTLGKVGQTGRVACAGCHIPRGGFSDTRSFQLQISLGAGWGRRRAPSLLDVGQARLLMWDGRRDTLYDQIFGPLETVVEMNSSRLYMAEQLFQRYRSDYEAVFGAMPALGDAARFPALAAADTGCQPMNPTDPAPACDGTFHGMPGDGAEYDGMTSMDQEAVTRVVVNAGKAIGAFERLLTCGVTPFDAWMHGGAPTPPAAQRGARLFVGKAGCVKCHSGPFLSDQAFHDVGLEPEVVQQDFLDSNDVGAAAGIAFALTNPLGSTSSFSDGSDERLPKAVTATMTGAFRTPILRCASLRPTFMHTGQFQALSDVVAFFDRGGDASGFPGKSEIHPLGLSREDESDLVTFLDALAGPGPPTKYQAAPP
jgi:cytochrome c peroxidase